MIRPLTELEKARIRAVYLTPLQGSDGIPPYFDRISKILISAGYGSSQASDLPEILRDAGVWGPDPTDLLPTDEEVGLLP